MQRGRSTIHRNAIFRADFLADRTLERRYGRPLGQEVRLEGLSNRVDIRRANVLPPVGNESQASPARRLKAVISSIDKKC